MASELSCVQVPREESKEDSASQQPWFLFTDGKNRLIHNNMFNNKALHNNCYYDVGVEIPEFLGRFIGCSFREWVLLYGSYDDGLPEVLVNLLSKETIELPLMDFQCNFCILTSPPSDPTCRVVFFDQQKNSLIIWQPGDKEFTIKKWDYEIFSGTVVAVAVVAGKLFIEISNSYGDDSLVMVEFKESTYPVEVVEMEEVQEDDIESEYRDSCQHYFFEYSGELFAANKIACGIQSSNVAGFKIFKADLSNKKWVRIKNLGRLAIFIGWTVHAHCAAVDSGIANSIYFLENNDRDSYYVYNLETGTIRIKPIFNYMGTKGMKLHWIMMHADPPFPMLVKEDQEIIRQDSEGRSRTARKKKKNKKNKNKKKDEVQDSVKENGEVEQDEVQESWNMVPPELLNLIQLRLFGRDHAVFRGVCKAWQQTSIQDYSIPSLLSSERLLEQCQSSSPLLMYQEDLTSSCDSGPIFRFLDPVHRKLYRTRIPELKEADIQYSSDGWSLVSRSSDQSIFFFNPLTQEKIELPRMPPDLSPPYIYTFKGFLSFSSSPTCSNCLVFGIDYYGSAYILKHGDETWREDGLYSGMRDWCNIVELNGLHYFMHESSKYKDMVVLNVNAEGQVLDRQYWVQKLRRSKSLDEEDFLVEIDGVLAFVTIEANGGEISILKWNDMEKDWELMEGDAEFGGKQMFLSKKGSFMEKIDDVGGMGNIIFLPMIDDAKDGVFYSFATEKYHTFYSGYSSTLPYNVDKFSNGIWVKPDRKIVGQNNLK